MSHPKRYVRAIRVLSLIALAILFCFILPAPGSASVPPASRHPPTPADRAARQTSDLSAAKRDTRLDSTLAAVATAAHESIQAARTYAAAADLRTVGDRIQVQVRYRASSRDAVVAAIAHAGGSVTRVSSDGARLQAWLPIPLLETLAHHADLLRIEHPATGYAVGTLQAGSLTTEGLGIMNAPAWHAAGYTGVGTQIAVIDFGFQGYSSLLGSDLPANLIAKDFVDGEDDSQVDSGTDPHGTACAEIVYDVAPGAQLYLIKIATELDLEQAVDWLISQHINVISTSLAWYATTPGDGTGFFANLTSRARAAGITWVTASGNERQNHWEGPFNDPNGDQFHKFFGDEEVDYIVDRDGAPLFLDPGQNLRVFLSWDDWTHVDQDYDLSIQRWNGQAWEVVGQSNNLQSGLPGQTPTEAAYAMTSGGSTYYGVAIYRSNSNRPVNLKLVMPRFDSVYYHLNRYVAARSLANLADAPAALTVGAVDSFEPYDLAEYSSEGPTDGPGGTLQAGLFKPELTAYTFVSTVTFGTGNFRFIGTSAATPHVAGAAALLLNWHPQTSATTLKLILQQRAIDLGPPGADTQFGYGRLYLETPRGGELYLPLIQR
jgi:subtilisin family serine protease